MMPLLSALVAPFDQAKLIGAVPPIVVACAEPSKLDGQLAFVDVVETVIAAGISKEIVQEAGFPAASTTE